MSGLNITRRINFLFIFLLLLNIILILRLFYWQVIAAEKTKALAWKQYRSSSEIVAFRGSILTNDNFPLVSNEKTYLLFASLPNIVRPIEEIVNKLAPVIVSIDEQNKSASQAGLLKNENLREKIKQKLQEDLNNSELLWIPIRKHLNKEQKISVEDLQIKGLGFEDEEIRLYPEASMASHILGFLGKDESGQNKGYFGLEGFYDLELKGRSGSISQENDANRNPILIGSFLNQDKKNGNNLVLHLDRSVQLTAENRLKEAIQKYGASAGSVVVMDPFSGGIMAMASVPSYNPGSYYNFDKALYKNPIITDTYEPGSTFKIFTMATALNEGIIKQDTICTICQEPVKIDKYLIKTWNDKYYPNSTMTEVLEHSDNVGMVFISQKLTTETFLQYITKFGFGKKTNIDLQEEVSAVLKAKEKWSYVDLATASFGQGLAVTAIQMVRAGAIIANGGDLVEPHLVDKIITGDKTINIKPKIIKEVIKPATAKMVTDMMVQAVEKGETRYLKIPGYKIAGKTGTAQIPIAGHYDQEKTIASFIGFAPVSKPKFIMLVTLKEPKSSPWGSETAAPLFFKIAKDLLVYYGVQPD